MVLTTQPTWIAGCKDEECNIADMHTSYEGAISQGALVHFLSLVVNAHKASYREFSRNHAMI